MTNDTIGIDLVTMCVNDVDGETAEMAGMYAPGEYDLAGFSVGAVRKRTRCPASRYFQTMCWLSSSGVHSNGYSLVRVYTARVDSPPRTWRSFAHIHHTQQ